MGIFSKTADHSDLENHKSEVRRSLDSETNNLDSFKAQVLDQLKILQENIDLKVTDSEEVASTAANNAVNSEKRIMDTESKVRDAIEKLESYRDEASKELLKIKTEREGAEEAHKSIKLVFEENQALQSQIIDAKDAVENAVTEASKNVDKVKLLLSENQKLPESVAGINELLESTRTLSDNMQNLLDHSLKKKSEIDDLYNKIYGYEVKGSDGDVSHIDGLRDELQRSYEAISKNTTELDTKIQNLTGTITDKHRSELEGQLSAFETLVNDSKSRISAINDQLTGLLPGAMAEGLSAAYEKKKDDEIKSLAKFENNFQTAIIGMVFVSLIPFCVDIYLLAWKGANLVQVIKDTPSLIVAILPLYFPVLWLAFSTNKKSNLSKRLIEEYTHKAVLGKTFSGLSNQIETLPRESAIKEELRTRLLFNLLQVSSENPGKLITNYNKSDHPLMEALENSAKLSDSVDALAKLPGFSTIAKKLATRTEDILKEETKKVEAGLAVQEALEGTTK
ncbi:hypothetical protein EV700_2766 [Fluviicoccus keumensis]|uniref:Uncharacterized protein n=1 Tax=Fluviicoccus keumensis TaxID=1435465 RepID=A0A4Q7YLM2_9GAMM|nr:hypothetical protein [Fluviicoccus keumensis]RZU38188.1 hypothetical protein EV700_2766 [Fluviicoccus keumensis]